MRIMKGSGDEKDQIFTSVILAEGACFGGSFGAFSARSAFLGDRVIVFGDRIGADACDIDAS